jgi:hypothetical protein
VFVQETVGRAGALLASARAHLFEVVGDMWQGLVAGEPLSEVQHARFTTLNSHVIALCVEVVQLVFKASGGTAVYQKGPLDRCLRDVLTMNQHVVATPHVGNVGPPGDVWRRFLQKRGPFAAEGRFKWRKSSNVASARGHMSVRD